eukprot:Ihof_evm2s496 gene=Ihof_evmTU2s496
MKMKLTQTNQGSQHSSVLPEQTSEILPALVIEPNKEFPLMGDHVDLDQLHNLLTEALVSMENPIGTENDIDQSIQGFNQGQPTENDKISPSHSPIGSNKPKQPGDQPTSRRPSLLASLESTIISEDEHAYIRVGEEYQAEIPPMLRDSIDPDSCPGSVLVWAPCDWVDADKLTREIKAVLGDSLYNWLKEDQFLAILYWNRYDVTRTIRDLKTITLLDENKRLNQWKPSDCNLFKEGMAKHSKDFNAIRKEFLPNHSISSLVAYYYYWKNSRHTNANPGLRKRALLGMNEGLRPDGDTYAFRGRAIKRLHLTSCYQCGAELPGTGRPCDVCGAVRATGIPST